MRTIALALLVLVLGAAPAAAGDDPKPAPPPTLSPWLVGRLGVSTPERAALEYEERGRLYVLTQWPANGGSIDAFPALRALDPDCRDARVFPGAAQGIIWSTPSGIVATLRPDGASDAAVLVAEWHRLVRRGACR